VIKSPGQMLGYIKDPEATRESMFEGGVRTGDLGYIGEDGHIFSK